MKVNLTEKQLRRLYNGHNVQIKPADIGAGDYDFSKLEAKQLKKLEKAKKLNKGFRMTPDLTMGAGILGSLKKFGKSKIGLSDGDIKAIGNFSKPILRNFRNSSQKGLTEVAAVAPQIAAQEALKAMAGAGVLSSIRKKTGLSKGDMKAVKGFMKPVLRAGRKSSQEALTQFAEEAPRVAAQQALSALAGGSVNPYLPTEYLSQTGGAAVKPKGVRVYKDGYTILRPDQPGFKASSEVLAPRPNQQSFTGGGFKNSGGGFKN